MKIIVSCDHAGFEALKMLEECLSEKGYKVIDDFTPKQYDKVDDYPDFIVPAMKKVQKEPESFGIVFCKNGVGVSMLANKFKGVRAALSFNKKHAESARADDDANVLALPIDYLSDEEICEIALTFLETKFSDLPRHVRRLEKVALEEDENFK